MATQHVGAYRGIMFDYTDTHQRQGCAVFYNAIAGSAPYDQRARCAPTCTRSGTRSTCCTRGRRTSRDPPQPLGDNSGFGDFSWMNYTWNYQPSSGPGGDAAYWSAFPFQFTDDERHPPPARARTTTSSMGANPFAKGAAEIDPDSLLAPAEDRSGRLEVRSKRNFGYGEPVVVEIKLSATDTRGTATHGYLHPNDDFTTIAIRQPSGRIVLYRPMLRRCADEDREVRVGADLALYKSAYIGHGRDGGYFDAAGPLRDPRRLRRRATASASSRR